MKPNENKPETSTSKYQQGWGYILVMIASPLAGAGLLFWAEHPSEAHTIGTDLVSLGIGVSGIMLILLGILMAYAMLRPKIQNHGIF